MTLSERAENICPFSVMSSVVLFAPKSRRKKEKGLPTLIEFIVPLG
jgi:hypothetical protein